MRGKGRDVVKEEDGDVVKHDWKFNVEERKNTRGHESRWKLVKI